MLHIPSAVAVANGACDVRPAAGNRLALRLPLPVHRLYFIRQYLFVAVRINRIIPCGSCQGYRSRWGPWGAVRMQARRCMDMPWHSPLPGCYYEIACRRRWSTGKLDAPSRDTRFRATLPAHGFLNPNQFPLDFRLRWPRSSFWTCHRKPDPGDRNGQALTVNEDAKIFIQGLHVRMQDIAADFRPQAEYRIISTSITM
jgi:hypothetical protein